MTDKTPTERLCELLDERGVEHETTFLWDGRELTEWTVDGYDWKADSGDELVCLSLDTLITPEQAVEATLGRGECELINAADDLGKGTQSCMCYACGYTALDDWWNEFNYCPYCGRKVVSQ